MYAELRHKLSYKMGIGKRGFTLFEALAAALIITIVGSGIAAAYLLESGLAAQTSHRLQAINYARAAAEIILETAKQAGKFSPNISAGVHTENTDPDICSLPDTYFKKDLKGKVKYIVTDVVSGSLTGRQIEITVTWQEKFPKAETKTEELVTAVF